MALRLALPVLAAGQAAVPDRVVELVQRIPAQAEHAEAVEELLSEMQRRALDKAEEHELRYYAGARAEGLFSGRVGYGSAAGLAKYLEEVRDLSDSLRRLAPGAELLVTAPEAEADALEGQGLDVWRLADWSFTRPEAMRAKPAFVGVGALYVVTDRQDFEQTFGDITRAAAAQEPETVQFGVAFKENATGTYAYMREGYASPAGDHTHFLAIQPLIESGVFGRSFSTSPFSRIFVSAADMAEEQTVRSPTEGICAIKTEGCDFFTLSDEIYFNLPQSEGLLV